MPRAGLFVRTRKCVSIRLMGEACVQISVPLDVRLVSAKMGLRDGAVVGNHESNPVEIRFCQEETRVGSWGHLRQKRVSLVR